MLLFDSFKYDKIFIWAYCFQSLLELKNTKWQIPEILQLGGKFNLSEILFVKRNRKDKSTVFCQQDQYLTDSMKTNYVSKEFISYGKDK